LETKGGLKSSGDAAREIMEQVRRKFCPTLPLFGNKGLQPLVATGLTKPAWGDEADQKTISRSLSVIEKDYRNVERKVQRGSEKIHSAMKKSNLNKRRDIRDQNKEPEGSPGSHTTTTSNKQKAKSTRKRSARSVMEMSSPAVDAPPTPDTIGSTDSGDGARTVDLGHLGGKPSSRESNRRLLEFSDRAWMSDGDSNGMGWDDPWGDGELEPPPMSSPQWWSEPLQFPSGHPGLDQLPAVPPW